MPQFDFYSFSTQIFYVLLGFIFFHFFILNYIVISYAQVLKLRQKLFNTYLAVNTNKTTKSSYDLIISMLFKIFK